ncbi:MAG: ABC-type Fe3+ transport system, periplasmic component (FbpA/afuA) [Acetothermia bacterium 64_32]|nr:MAG: ABC-type Fe3+ transport system, periplasmic component (FbpA/afuA) [Acetothermia bacterium 64_32]HAF70774.1 ABC transporter substrate-binding protein [Candidatus Acetothermia bacterium]
MRKLTSSLLVAVLAGLIALPALAEKETLMVYTSCPIEIMTEIERVFEAAHPEIDVQVYRSGTGTITAKIAAEREAGKILADIVWVADYAYFEGLKGLDLLYPYESPEAKNLPEIFVDPDRCYYGARIFSMVIAYNTLLVDDPPRRWTDLLDPKWRGQLVTGNPQYSGSNVVATTALCLEYGLSYLKGLRENEIAVVRGNSQAAAEIAAGAYMVGFTLDNIARGMKAQGSPIDLVYPEDGAVFLPSPIAIIKTSEHIEAAKTFVDFVLSPAGQEALVEYGSYIPARPDVAPPPDTPTVDQIHVMDLPLSFLMANKDFYTDQFIKLLLEE